MINSPLKILTLSRTFFLKNENLTALEFIVETSGIIFKVKKVKTINQIFLDYNPKVHILKISPGQCLEVGGVEYNFVL